MTATIPAPAATPAASMQPKWAKVSLATEAIAARGGLILLAAGLLVFLTVPLAMILVKSAEDRAGMFVGLANFATYFASPSVAISLKNSLTFAVLTTLTTVPLAFAFAYAIQRSCIPLKSLWR